LCGSKGPAPRPALDRCDRVADDLDQRVRAVVALVRLDDLVLDVHGRTHHVEAVAVRSEVDVLSGPLPAVHVAPAGRESEHAVHEALAVARTRVAAADDRVGCRLVEGTPVAEKLVGGAEAGLGARPDLHEAGPLDLEQLVVEDVVVVEVPVEPVEGVGAGPPLRGLAVAVVDDLEHRAVGERARQRAVGQVGGELPAHLERTGAHVLRP